MAPTTTAPLGSVTVPLMLPDTACAFAALTLQSKQNTARRKGKQRNSFRVIVVNSLLKVSTFVHKEPVIASELNNSLELSGFRGVPVIPAEESSDR
ncbi:MAG: hypothetical protein P4L03_05970 [Terracidiphilus sp.]|nr:hypothetical protein [Terracidiphilus sp.]